MPMEHCDVENIPPDVHDPPEMIFNSSDPHFLDFVSATIHTELVRHADATVKIFTGGKSVAHPNRQSILELFVPVTGFSGVSTDCGVAGNMSVRPGLITVGDLGRPNDFDYTLYAVLPRGGPPKDITVHAPPKRYVWGEEGDMHDLVVECVCDIPKNKERTEVGVGEQVSLSFKHPMSWHFPLWSHEGGGLNTNPNIPANGTLYTASSNAVTDRVTAGFPKGGGGYVTVITQFEVRAPTGLAFAKVAGSADCDQVGQASAGFHLRVVMAPTNVSLSRAEIMEVEGPATDAIGWFSPPPSGHGAPAHDSAHRANQWYQLGCDNAWTALDYASSGVLAAPWSTANWSGGGYTWVIPVQWKVGNGSATRIGTWTQAFSLTSDGTVTITKFGHSVIRHSNQECGTTQ